MLVLLHLPNTSLPAQLLPLVHYALGLVAAASRRSPESTTRPLWSSTLTTRADSWRPIITDASASRRTALRGGDVTA